jgi:hypothetical protein
MSEPLTPSASSPPTDSEDIMTALFANLVLQQTQMALMLLGRVAHPETGQTVQDVDGARMLIDQLEMLEVKTKGNLTEPESRLLKQNLMALHMAFVEAVERAGSTPPPAAPGAAAAAPAEATASHAAATDAATSAADADSRKKFSKKY